MTDALDTIAADASGNPIANVTRTSYHSTGQVAGVWGDQTYATFKRYDEQERLTELRTYQDLAHNVEPTEATTGFAATNWIYDAQRGWLVEKNYAGETDDGVTDPDYAYTAAGRLATRTWERGVSTTYSYDAGHSVSTDYSDTTPDIAQSYDHFGRIVAVTRGRTAACFLHLRSGLTGSNHRATEPRYRGTTHHRAPI